MRRLVAVALTLVLCSAGIFGFDFSGKLHFDTYDGSPTFGFSFDAEGKITGSIGLNARLDYFTANSYEAQCLVVGKIWQVTLGAGVAYSIDNSAKNIIVPGVGLSAGMDLPLGMGLSANAILSLAPANLYEAYSFRVGGAFMFGTENADSALEYSLKQSAEREGRIHSVAFSVDAFEEGVPFTLSCGFGLGFITGSDTELLLPFEFHVEGGFSVRTGRAGTYSLEGRVTPFTYRDAELPFEVRLGAAFSMD